jgi:LysM repeat protein
MKYILCLLLFFIGSIGADAQTKIASYEKYVSQYSDLAVQHQQKYHIPASITLAQGLLESGAGLSELARNSNNHFGIKCHSGWKGAKAYHDDDLRNECFRKYKTVDESYEDHSLFLTGSSRYAGLFKLHPTDYLKWAKGLQEAGYATDKAYANRLIKPIEDYELFLYDSGKTPAAASPEKKQAAPKKTRKPVEKKTEPPLPPVIIIVERPVDKVQGLASIRAFDNDSIEQIAKDTGFTTDELYMYNEMPVHYPLQKGDIIYLVKKKKKANKPYYDHVVQIGESMHSISQKYGLQVKSLYKINKKKEDYVPAEGDVLKLR